MTIPTALAAPHSLDDQKKAARAKALRVMDNCDPVSVGQRLALRIWSHILPGAVVGGYYAMGREPDFLPLLRVLWSTSKGAECVVALPRTPALGLPLTFHRWAEHDSLEDERFGTKTSSGPQVVPTVLLVPLLAFDRRGHRLGYGGGYYDRTIAASPGVRTIGCAYAALELPEVPVGDHDMSLDAIATETEFINIKAN